MKNIKTYEIINDYTLVMMEDTERGYLDFSVKTNNVNRPEIMVESNYEDPTFFMVKVLTAGVGALDMEDLGLHITKLEEAWEAAEIIRETIMQNFPVRVS